MPKRLTTWTPKEKNLIKVVKSYPILYTTDPLLNRDKYNKATRPTWLEVATKICSSIERCRRKWFDLKYIYVKLKDLILIGIVSEKAVREHIKTSKYMDGSIDFLDPYIIDIPIYNLPNHVRSFVYSAFPPNSWNTLNIDVQNECNLAQNVAIQLFDTPLTQMEPTSILPTYEDEEMEDDNTETFLVGHSLGENSKMHQSFKEEIIGDNKVLTILETVEHRLPNIIQETEYETVDDNLCIEDSHEPTEVMNVITVEDNINIKLDDNKDTDTCDPLKVFLKKHDNESDTRIGINEYLKDLADLLCLRLPVDQRQPFLSKIDSLVSDVLEK